MIGLSYIGVSAWLFLMIESVNQHNEENKTSTENQCSQASGFGVDCCKAIATVWAFRCIASYFFSASRATNHISHIPSPL